MASFSPGALAGAGNILQAGGAANSIVGSYYSSQAQKSALEFQAMTAQTNAALAEKSAQSVLLSGEAQAHQVQLHTAALKGTQRAALASNGVDLGEGSAARIQSDTTSIGKMDAETTAANAVRAAWGYRTQATNYENSARFTQAQADTTSPTAAMFSSLLGGASGVAGNWYKQTKAGV